MRPLAIFLAILVIGTPTLASDSPLVGTWKLISATSTSPDGKVDPEVYGAAPHGYISYTEDGHMMVLFTFSDRPNLNGSWISAPEAERAQAFATVLGYGGTYSVDGNTVTHHVTVATDPNRVGESLSRTFKIAGDRITLTTPPIALLETANVYTLVWERASSPE